MQRTYESHEADVVNAGSAAAQEADDAQKNSDRDEDERKVLVDNGRRRHVLRVVTQQYAADVRQTLAVEVQRRPEQRQAQTDHLSIVHAPENKLCARPPRYAPAPCKLHFDLLTLKVVSESRVSVPILFFLGLTVLDLGPSYVTDRQTSDAHHRLMPAYGGGDNGFIYIYLYFTINVYGSTNNKQYIIKRINTTHTHAHTHTHTKLMSADD